LARPDADSRLPAAGAAELRAALSELFDPAWYLAAYPLVRDEDPLDHFIAVGAAIGCDPHPLFDTAWYCARYPDVLREGWNPLHHFLLHGGARALRPHPLFDTPWYMARWPEVAERGVNPLLHYLNEGAARGAAPNVLFDADAVRRGNPAVGNGPLAPIFELVSRLRRRAAGQGDTEAAPCALWNAYARWFAPTPTIASMDDPIATPICA
jgi:hypothetical protein